MGNNRDDVAEVKSLAQHNHQVFVPVCMHLVVHSISLRLTIGY